MELFRRITDLITPPPEKTNPRINATAQAVARDHTETPSADLGLHVKTLVSAPTHDHPKALQAIEELKRIARESGLYVTASKMRYQLDVMPRVDAEGTILWKDRAYVLSADFIYQHILNEARALEGRERPMGPNIYRGYCNELVSCLLRGRNIRRAIEMPVVILDELLRLALETPGFRNEFLELAEVTAEVTAIQAEGKLESEQRDRNRRRQEQKRGDSDGSEPAVATTVFDVDTVLYIRELHAFMTKLRGEVAKVPALPFPGADPAAVMRYGQSLQMMASAADRAGYAGFSAMVRIRYGTLFGPGNEQQASAVGQQAAVLYETLGDRERTLNLSKLSALRYRQAMDLFNRAGNRAKVEEVREKLNAL